jgi:hypothetical protein
VTLLLVGVVGCTAEPGTEPAGRAAPAGSPPAAADPAPAAPDPPPLAAAAVRTPSAVAVACDQVEEALIDAVARYEVLALAEDGLGSGDRTAAWTDMGEAMDRAALSAGTVPGLAAGTVPGLAAAAAPAMAEVAALRDGLAFRTTLDEDDAEPWRDARDRLEAWCDGQD